MTAGNDIPGFASPPCYRHELDPDCPDNAGGSSDWEVIRSWRVRTRSELRAYRDGLGQAERTQIATAIGDRKSVV